MTDYVAQTTTCLRKKLQPTQPIRAGSCTPKQCSSLVARPTGPTEN